MNVITTNTPQWLAPPEAQSMVPPKTWALMSHPGSLTQKLRELSNGQMQFRLIDASWGAAYPDEAEKLGVPPSESLWIRNIEMRYQDKLWVYGRGLAPKATLLANNDSLQTAGSIGDIIFKDPNLKRDAFEYCQLTEKNAYYQPIKSALNDTEEPIWARRSILYFHQKPILVVEIFLPEVLLDAN